MESVSNIANPANNAANGMQIIQSLIYERDVVKRTVSRELFAKLLANCTMIQNSMCGTAEFNPFDHTNCHWYKCMLGEVFQLICTDKDENEGNFTSIVLHHMDPAKNVPQNRVAVKVFDLPFHLKCEPSLRTLDSMMIAIRDANELIYEIDSKFGQMYENVLPGSHYDRSRSSSSSSSENLEDAGDYLMQKFLFEPNHLLTLLNQEAVLPSSNHNVFPASKGTLLDCGDFQAGGSEGHENEKS